MKRLAAALAAVLVVAAALAGFAAWQGSARGFRSRAGHIAAATLTPSGEDAVSTVWRLGLRSSAGLEVDALVRVPRQGSGAHAAAVLLGGVERGKGVATMAGLDPVARHTIIVAPDYPRQWQRPAWPGLGFLTMAAGLRPAVFDTVADIVLLLDYLESRPDVARDRLVLIGSSLGAPAVTIAGGVDRRPAAVIALYGAGQIDRVVAHALEHAAPSPHPRWRAALLGRVFAWWLAPLAPERYAPDIAPRPFLMVNSEDDRLIPRASVLALYEAARPPKELIWVPGEHIHPDEAELIQKLSGTVTSWLVAREILPRGVFQPAGTK